MHVELTLCFLHKQSKITDTNNNNKMHQPAHANEGSAKCTGTKAAFYESFSRFPAFLTK
jgi:hypothetical protein